MDLVEQIEIVRGPSSALYGGNGIFATINIITKTAANAPRARVSTELGSFGEQKMIAASSFSLGRDVQGLVSASALHTGGRTVDFPELAEAGLSPSGTDHSGDQSGFRMFATLA